MEDNNHQAQVLITHTFKMRFGARLFLIVIAGVSVIAATLHFLIFKNPGRTYYEAQHYTYRMKAEMFNLVFLSYGTAVFLGFIVVVVTVITVRFSHRIVGPLHRLEKRMDSLGQGDLVGDIRFRTYDAFTQIADETNAAVRRLNHEARSSQDAVAQLIQAEEKVKKLLEFERSGQDEIRQAVEELNVGVQALKRVTDRIKAGEQRN